MVNFFFSAAKEKDLTSGEDVDPRSQIFHQNSTHANVSTTAVGIISVTFSIEIFDFFHRIKADSS